MRDETVRSCSCELQGASFLVAALMGQHWHSRGFSIWLCSTAVVASSWWRSALLYKHDAVSYISIHRHGHGGSRAGRAHLRHAWRRFSSIYLLCIKKKDSMHNHAFICFALFGEQSLSLFLFFQRTPLSTKEYNSTSQIISSLIKELQIFISLKRSNDTYFVP